VKTGKFRPFDHRLTLFFRNSIPSGVYAPVLLPVRAEIPCEEQDSEPDATAVLFDEPKTHFGTRSQWLGLPPLAEIEGKRIALTEKAHQKRSARRHRRKTLDWKTTIP